MIILPPKGDIIMKKITALIILTLTISACATNTTGTKKADSERMPVTDMMPSFTF
ncbi:MAG: hypothetical protein K0R98_1960 [Rickettsiaceae bacterium]|jgi:hypothetical protein|nr:hypothetical protein [Rickettsiaceae bacterium]